MLKLSVKLARFEPLRTPAKSSALVHEVWYIALPMTQLNAKLNKE